ncbi:MAG: Crp/Fnr family transcriptional regulator, partial [Thermoanaerobaculia bacterium]
MAEPSPPPSAVSRTEQMFPTLTPEQVARIAEHGNLRRVERGEVLVEAGDQSAPFFVVKSGQLEIVRPSAGAGDAGNAEALVVVHEPGQFTGEVNMLSGRRSLVRARATEPGEVIELGHGCLRALVQTD